MITELTPEQEALIPVVRDEWIDIGLSTDRADRPKAEAILAKIYKSIGVPLPQIIWVESPRGAYKYNSKPDFIYNNNNIGWLAFYDYFARIGVKYTFETDLVLDDINDLAKSMGWIAPYDTMVICCERPCKIMMEDGVLHSAAGPAIEFTDGFKVYSWRGTRIPGSWIEESPPPAAAILKIENMEQRHAACQIKGWIEILKELDAKVINEDEDPTIGVLLEAELPDIGTTRFLKVFDPCGKRTHALTVPLDMQTAHEANAWTYGIDPKFFNPEFRT